MGKATFARAIGRALHCAQAPGVGCGACDVCRRIDAGHHPGVEWLAPQPGARSMGGGAARSARLRAERAPLEGPAHLLVVDPADALTPEAANTLLKTIEEPPPAVHFALVSHNLRSLLPTIVSRCLLVRFGRLADADVAAILRERVADLPPQRADAVVALAEGSAGLALELAADEHLPAHLALLDASLAAAAGGPPEIFTGDEGPVWAALAQACAGPATGRTARERAAVARLVDLWLLHLRRGLAGAPGPTGARAEQGAERTAAQMELLLRARRMLERNGQVRLILEHILLHMGAPTWAVG